VLPVRDPLKRSLHCSSLVWVAPADS